MALQNKIAQVKKDPNFVFLMINALLVIIGYAWGVHTDGDSAPTMKIIKSAVLFFSLIVIFRDLNFSKKIFAFPSFIYMIVFSFLVILMAFFGKNTSYSIGRALDFLVPFLYVYLSLQNLLRKYHVYDILRASIEIFNLIYMIPILAFLITGRGILDQNIYGTGDNQGQYFVSNQYGWSSCFFILTSIDILINTKRPRYYIVFHVIMIFIAFYLLLISGNRSSWLAMALAILIFVMRLKIVRTDLKIISLILPFTIVMLLISIPDSSLNVRFSDTERQIDSGEERFLTAQMAANYFNQHKYMWITGAGMFNYEEVIPNSQLSDYHNSYFEILFGGGIILLILFVSFMLFRPVYLYAVYYSKYFLCLSPLIVIPYFEANITGGQFLFYPWFIIILLFNIHPVGTKEKSTPKKNVYLERRFNKQPHTLVS